MKPASLDQYEFRLAVHGSTSDIYLARLRRVKSFEYILKIMKERYSENAILRERFYAESDILKNLDHPCIPKLEFASSINGRPYFIYKRIMGTPLDRYLQKTDTIHANLRHSIFRQLLDLLHYIHTRADAIAHCDISPHNLILDRDNRIHLIDFGCAQHISTYTPANTWIGKLHYLSPEQAQGRPWDQRSDLYQAGLVFYELFTHARYFDTCDRDRLISLAANPSKKDFTGIPAPFRFFLRKLLQVDPSLRYQSAEQCIRVFSGVTRNCGSDSCLIRFC